MQTWLSADSTDIHSHRMRAGLAQAELEDRERAHPETRIRTPQEVED